MVFSDAYIVQEIAEINPQLKINTKTGILKGESALSVFLEQNRIPILTVLAKKDAVLAVGAFTEKPEIQNAEDYHLWLKLLLKGNSFYGSEEVLAAYRVHQASSTAKDKNAHEQILETLLEIGREFPEMNNLIIRSLYHRYLMDITNLRSKINVIQQTRTFRWGAKLHSLKGLMKIGKKST